MEFDVSVHQRKKDDPGVMFTARVQDHKLAETITAAYALGEGVDHVQVRVVTKTNQQSSPRVQSIL
jgi:hypothetical protein